MNKNIRRAAKMAKKGADKAGRGAGWVLNKIFNEKNFEAAAGKLNKTILATKKAASKIKNVDYNKMASDFNKSFITDPSSYKKAGNRGYSKKMLVGDAIQSEAKEFGDMAAAAFESISSDKNPFQLLKKTSIDDSLIGWKLTGLGKAGAFVGAAAMGVPRAAEEYVESFRGFNVSQQAETSAPKTPAYADNAGATGDLVFALNNLRHGGMM